MKSKDLAWTMNVHWRYKFVWGEVHPPLPEQLRAPEVFSMTIPILSKSLTLQKNPK